MRLKPRAFLLAALVALVGTGTAVAGNGGFGPVDAASPNAERTSDAYWVVFGLTSFVFVLVEGTLVLFLLRFRSRRRARQVDGPQIRGHTKLEIAWTTGPVLILAAIAAFVFYKLPGIQDAPAARAADRLTIRVEAHQFYWQFVYPDGQVAIDRMVVPAGRVVSLDVTSPDVVHSWWVPALGGKIDAIPGRTTHTWFQADTPGVYRGQCAELCGLEHASMRATVEVVGETEFARFLASHAPGSRTVAEEVWGGVCAKCHGAQGEGDYGRPLRNNPIVEDEAAVRLVLEEGRRLGTRVMPPINEGWSDEQTDAVLRYLKAELGPGGA